MTVRELTLCRGDAIIVLKIRFGEAGFVINIVYCGYDFFSCCLEELLDSGSVRVLKVFACGKDENRSRRLAEIAKSRRIPLTYKLIDRGEIERLFLKEGCDFLIAAGYPKKLPAEGFRGMNIHPSLLPVGRGPWPMPRVILEGRTESGVTFHKLAERFDEGDIILQKRFPVSSSDTEDTLNAVSRMAAKELIREWLKDPEGLWEKAEPQGEGVYWKGPTVGEMTVNGTEPPERIESMLRAYSASGLYYMAGGKRRFAERMTYIREEHGFEPGTELFSDGEYRLVAVNGGKLCIGPIKRAKPGFAAKAKRGLKRIGSRLKGKKKQ